MNSKSIPFKTTLEPMGSAEMFGHKPASGLENFSIESRKNFSSPSHEIMKRFTIDVSEDLHKRIKTQCALRGAKMADVMREILEHEFPKG